MDLRALSQSVRRGEIDTVLTVFPDMQGRLLGKRVTGRFFVDEVARRGVHACAYLLTADMEMDPRPGYELASWESGYQDFHAVPDLPTLRRIPWLEKTALVMCDLEDEDGEPIEVSPRRILRRQVERARRAGFKPMIGSELEFYLFKQTYESARAGNYHGLEPYGWYLEDYHILQGTREEPVIRDIRNGMEGAGIPVEFSKGEWGAGQQEINLRYAEALEMADRHAIYKHGAKEIAMRHGVSLTFMAKWDPGRAGSSCHIHSSLAGARKDLFEPWLAGQLACARDLSLFYAPTVNSYKRYQAGSFAPTRIVWGRDNRTCGFRVLGRRVENRTPGGDANPYLAFAATIAAGLHGIGRKLKPPPEYKGDAYRDASLSRLPATLAEAIGELEKSGVARGAFGEAVVRHYLQAAREEQAAFDRAVTCWELTRYFERI